MSAYTPHREQKNAEKRGKRMVIREVIDAVGNEKDIVIVYRADMPVALTESKTMLCSAFVGYGRYRGGELIPECGRPYGLSDSVEGYEVLYHEGEKYISARVPWDLMPQPAQGTSVENGVEKERKDLVLREFADALDGLEYGDSFDSVIEKAKEAGVVIVTGQSDDLIELDGAITDEEGCYGGGKVYVGYGKTCCWITAVWCGEADGAKIEDISLAKDRNGNIIPWTYITDIPHRTFMVYEDGEPFCRGLVFFAEDM